MVRGLAAALICGWCLCFAVSAYAHEPDTLWTPDSVADAIEAKAIASSFAGLEQFGRDSFKVAPPERLRRLDHVAWLFVNQSDFKRFNRWNQTLAHEAALAHDRRFQMVATLNDLRSRYDQGEASTIHTVATIADKDPDWYVRVHAMSIQSYMFVRESQVGEAVQRLSEAETLAPEADDPMARLAQSRIWESQGLALMQLHDLRAAATAFGRTQFDYGQPGYPRPDFDGIYNMTEMATRLGNQPLAERLLAIHHRLSRRADLHGLDVWDRNLCAIVAQHAAPKGVLDCLQDMDLVSAQSEARFLAPQLLPARAIAYAELGDVKRANDDLQSLYKLRDSKAFTASQFERIPMVEAELLHAKGLDREAFGQLQRFAEAHQIRDSQRFNAGIGQVTAQMQRQLSARRDQLATARRNVALEHDMLRTQYLLEGLGVLVGLMVAGLLFWQWRAAGQLRRARAAAEAANRAKSEFLANMSHEIRTPLNGVVAVADMLARSNLDPKSREMVEIICASGDTLQRLLSDILDVARIESGKVTIEAAPFHAGEMVRAVAGLSQLKCGEKGVRLVVRVAPEIDQAVIGDLVRVRQVLTNLLSNAVKFTDRGQVRLTAERTATGRARFTVEDTGVGFAMADKSKVLGRFEQADSSITRRFGGTGLGLSICCDLAQRMGGVLDCESAPGVGSRFWIELPLEAAPVQAPVEVTAQEDEPEVATGAIRILLADDHPTNRKIVELMLEASAAELVSVEDGALAVEMFKTQTFDLILMDMQMPVMDGLTAIRQIRSLEAAIGLARTPVILLTANALPEHVAEGRAAGADLHLSKPFTAPALFDAIATMLDGSEDQAAVA